MAFGLGLPFSFTDLEQRLTTLAQGLAALSPLSQRVTTAEERIDALQLEVDDLRGRVGTLEATVSALSVRPSLFSGWGDAPSPASISALQGDHYLDRDNGAWYQLQGSEWVYRGQLAQDPTNAEANPFPQA